MKISTPILHLFLVLGLTVSSTTSKCWYTDCQPNGGEFKGCNPSENAGISPLNCRGNRGTRGIQYYCCSSYSDGPSPTKNPAELVTFNQFKEALTKNGFKVPNQDQFNNFNRYALPLGGILDAEEAAMALAHIIHESDGLVRKREENKKGTMGITFTSMCRFPDQYYRGKGYIKLTGCNNYFIASEAIFGDFRLHENPLQVEVNDTVSWATSLYIWGERAHSLKDVQDGKFGASIKEINENECKSSNDPNAKRRFKIYTVVREAFGLPGMGDPSGCT
ncbi:unnamed protein product [Orchesella dallaii]|uniref:Chitinase n=1 Tax=Orchesella dallaii TaxID=48710 RepID=A0ABP1RIE5_9HEXA